MSLHIIKSQREIWIGVEADGELVINDDKTDENGELFPAIRINNDYAWLFVGKIIEALEEYDEQQPKNKKISKAH